jgi:LytS/YehU family sensor histidine kinase
MSGSIHICIASIITVGSFFDTYICQFPLVKDPNIFYICLGIALNVSIMILFFEFGIQIFRKWKQSLIEIEQHKALTAQAKLENLQHQVNPHFLFNNMSVLTSLIYKDQDKAVDFVNQLSKVYRYLLDNKNNELVSVEQELVFIESYAYLLNIRYSPNLTVKFNIPDTMLQHHLPPLSIQLLLENAIKHNVVSTASPLTIEITIEDEYLVVSNTKKLRKTKEDSSKTGIQNIRDRYHFFSSKAVIVEDTESSFIVKIPLLKTS